MKKINLLVLVLLTMVLSAGSCDDSVGAVVKDGVQNREAYTEAGKSVYKTVKETDIDNDSGVETVKNVVDSAQSVVGALSVIPVVGSYATPITIGLGLISTVLGFFVHSEKKKVKVVTKIADNYSQAMDVARLNGDEESVIEVEVLEKYLNQETKNHFNATGGTVVK